MPIINTGRNYPADTLTSVRPNELDKIKYGSFHILRELGKYKLFEKYRCVLNLPSRDSQQAPISSYLPAKNIFC